MEDFEQIDWIIHTEIKKKNGSIQTSASYSSESIAVFCFVGADKNDLLMKATAIQKQFILETVDLWSSYGFCQNLW